MGASNCGATSIGSRKSSLPVRKDCSSSRYKLFLEHLNPVAIWKTSECNRGAWDSQPQLPSAVFHLPNGRLRPILCPRGRSCLIYGVRRSATRKRTIEGFPDIGLCARYEQLSALVHNGRSTTRPFSVQVNCDPPLATLLGTTKRPIVDSFMDPVRAGGPRRGCRPFRPRSLAKN